ncbi:HTH-type transcriptional regulator PuuR [Bhargavaea cecembensis DSE10]|uniref:HTH-type transcriptional regulator PuuR n=1 Tax=Bhargavaea cecembensis DSE10 TaxID=1235279 RepID=M7P8M4_9BACL|nr:XRE family transcriptional regulator [Bhargavaea cecembensis]EMR06854.1 HTH-type transcriptional regulator PuuR [Bhargavaea cecembensis DSE10]
MNKTLGLKIKAIRKEKQKTLKQVAEDTGFSISFISQLERGKSSATLESLKKISVALGVSPGHFFEEEAGNSNQDGSMIMAERIAAYGVHYQNLAPGFNAPDFMPMQVTLEPGQNGGRPITHAGQEFVYVLEGTLTVEIGAGLTELAPGQSLFYDAGESHYWYNRSGGRTVFLCISSDTKP